MINYIRKISFCISLIIIFRAWSNILLRSRHASPTFFISDHVVDLINHKWMRKSMPINHNNSQLERNCARAIMDHKWTDQENKLQFANAPVTVVALAVNISNNPTYKYSKLWPWQRWQYFVCFSTTTSIDSPPKKRGKKQRRFFSYSKYCMINLIWNRG